MLMSSAIQQKLNLNTWQSAANYPLSNSPNNQEQEALFLADFWKAMNQHENAEKISRSPQEIIQLFKLANSREHGLAKRTSLFSAAHEGFTALYAAGDTWAAFFLAHIYLKGCLEKEHPKLQQTDKFGRKKSLILAVGYLDEALQMAEAPLHLHHEINAQHLLLSQEFSQQATGIINQLTMQAWRYQNGFSNFNPLYKTYRDAVDYAVKSFIPDWQTRFTVPDAKAERIPEILRAIHELCPNAMEPDLPSEEARYLREIKTAYLHDIEEYKKSLAPVVGKLKKLLANCRLVAYNQNRSEIDHPRNSAALID